MAHDGKNPNVVHDESVPGHQHHDDYESPYHDDNLNCVESRDGHDDGNGFRGGCQNVGIRVEVQSVRFGTKNTVNLKRKKKIANQNQSFIRTLNVCSDSICSGWNGK